MPGETETKIQDEKLADEIIDEFLACILNEKNTSSEISELPDLDKSFCDKYNKNFDALDSIDQFILQRKVIQKCNQYTKNLLLNKVSPYQFCNNGYKDKYIKCFNNYCNVKKYTVTLNSKLENVLDYVTLEWLEYENVNFQLQSKLDNYTFKYQDKDVPLSELKASVDKINTKLPSLKKETNKLTKDVNKSAKRITDSEKKVYETSIAVLGIFSAVVLAFNGALTLSTSAIEGLNNVSIYRLVIFILLMGFVLLNVFYALFYFINSLVIKNSTDKNEKREPLKKGFIWLTDGIIIVLIICTIVAWRCGAVENRNKEIYEATSTTMQQEGTTEQNSNNIELTTERIK